jgi:hypothetical protein
VGHPTTAGHPTTTTTTTRVLSETANKGVIQRTVLARTDHVETLSIEIGGLNEIIVDRLVVKRTIVHQQL